MPRCDFIGACFLFTLVACSSQKGGDDATAVVNQAASIGSSTTVASNAAAATDVTTPAALAAASLDDLSQLVASGPPEIRGFASVNEVATATPGIPLKVYMVLDSLKTFDSGQDARPLLIDLNDLMYPLMINGEVRTSVVVRKGSDNRWQAVEFGHIELMKRAHALRANVVAKAGISETQLSLVKFPALGASFLAHENNGTLMLTPAFDIPGTSLRAGETRTASDAFTILQPVVAASADPGASR